MRIFLKNASGNRMDIVVVMVSFQFLQRMVSVTVSIQGIMKKCYQGEIILWNFYNDNFYEVCE